jgi:uncharacterized protein YneF (UPF0154 family)
MKKTAATLKMPMTTPKTASSQPVEKLRVGRELLDTTWRVTLPVILFAVVGIFIDRAAGTKPWLTLLGAVFGFYIAALLIKRQLASGIQPMTDEEIKDYKKRKEAEGTKESDEDEDDE